MYTCGYRNTHTHVDWTTRSRIVERIPGRHQQILRGVKCKLTPTPTRRANYPGASILTLVKIFVSPYTRKPYSFNYSQEKAQFTYKKPSWERYYYINIRFRILKRIIILLGIFKIFSSNGRRIEAEIARFAKAIGEEATF